MSIVAIMVKLDKMKIYWWKILKACIVVPELLRALSGDVKAQTIDKDPTHIECSADKEIKISDKEINDFLDEHHLSINENILLHMFNNPEEYAPYMENIFSKYSNGDILSFPEGEVQIVNKSTGQRIILTPEWWWPFVFAWDKNNFSLPYPTSIPYRADQDNYNMLICKIFISALKSCSVKSVINSKEKIIQISNHTIFNTFQNNSPLRRSFRWLGPRPQGNFSPRSTNN